MRKRNGITVAVLATGALGAALWMGCGSADCSFDLTCGGPGDGGNEGSVLDGSKDATGDAGIDAPPGCDLTKDPKDSSACVDNSVGIFVDSTGSDGNPGTKTSPVQTVTKGLSLAKSMGLPRIYVCAGTYAEDVLVAQSTSIYGGFACKSWSYSAAQPVLGKTQLAMKLDAVSNVTVEDVEVDAADGTTMNPSSIAALVNASSGVTFKRVKLAAGAGFAGAPGAGGSNYTSVAQSDSSIAGKNGSGIAGGGPHACMLCTDGHNSTGGYGGNGGLGPLDGQDGTPNLGGMAPYDGKAGAKDTGGGCASGHKGAAGDAGAPAPSPTVGNTFDAMGLHASGGSAGVNGAVAQGGGGGGGGLDGTNMSGGGGGGGCGGCGGAAGTGGTGGGSSLALASLSSTVNVVASALVTKDAGAGGAGGAGQAGQAGGFGGVQASGGCGGGTGGTGGAGGSGSGGAGGLSVGVLYKGMIPMLDTMTSGAIVTGQKGPKGAGGTPGTNDGIDGVAAPTLECKSPVCM